MTTLIRDFPFTFEAEFVYFNYILNRINRNGFDIWCARIIPRQSEQKKNVVEEIKNSSWSRENALSNSNQRKLNERIHKQPHHRHEVESKGRKEMA